MNSSRIKSLLHYDWIIEKRNFQLSLIIISAIYLVSVIMYTLFMSFINISTYDDQQAIPYASAIFCSSFFSYAQIAAVIIVTQLLHHKFTNPRTSLSYLTLPGTNAEKWLTMLIDYAIAFICIYVLQLVMFEVTALLGFCLAPELDWIFNPFFAWSDSFINDYMNMQININGSGDAATEFLPAFIDQMQGFINVSKYFSLFVGTVELGIYIVLNMCFRRLGQLKTIAILAGSLTVLMIIFIFSLSAYMIHSISAVGDVSPTAVMDIIYGPTFSIFGIMKLFFYCSPLLAAAVLYLFYRQICKKQAK